MSLGSILNYITQVKKYYSAILFCLGMIIIPQSGIICAETNYSLNFSSEIQRHRYQHLLTQLRCPKCENQSLASSDAVISIDLRQRIYTLIKEGHSDTEIKNFLRQRYGDFILYQPLLKKHTLLLWFAPPLLLLGIIGGLMFYLRKHSITGGGDGTN